MPERMPNLIILTRSGIIWNTQNLKFVLQVETEVAYTTTVSNIV
jgi:hypothetical protein